MGYSRDTFYRYQTARDAGGVEALLENIDSTFMMIFLLEECNFSCDHCVRCDEPMAPGYTLTYEQLNTCLSDL